MTEDGFRLVFLDQPARTVADPADYQDYFLAYDPEKWAAEQEFGLFRYRRADRGHYCIFRHSREHGIVVEFGVEDGKSRSILKTWVTLAGEARIDEIVDVGSDELFSVGCFVTPQVAWPLVESFLRDPTTIPRSDVLVDSDTIDWPQMY